MQDLLAFHSPPKSSAKSKPGKKSKRNFWQRSRSTEIRLPTAHEIVQRNPALSAVPQVAEGKNIVTDGALVDNLRARVAELEETLSSMKEEKVSATVMAENEARLAAQRLQWAQERADFEENFRLCKHL